MTSSICRSLRPVIPPRSTPRLLGLSELHRPTTTQPPQQPNSAVINGHAPSDLLTDRPSQPWAHHPLTILYRMSNLRGAGKNDREGFSTAAFSLHRHHPQTLAFNTFGLRGFSTTTVGSAVPREIEAKGKRFGTAKKVISFTLLPNLALFCHINEGIEAILADYVHHEITRNLVVIYLRLFLLILAKDVFLSLV